MVAPSVYHDPGELLRAAVLPRPVRTAAAAGCVGDLHVRVVIDLVRQTGENFHVVAAVDDATGACDEVLGVPVVGTSA